MLWWLLKSLASSHSHADVALAGCSSVRICSTVSKGSGLSLKALNQRKDCMVQHGRDRDGDTVHCCWTTKGFCIELHIPNQNTVV